MTRRETPCMTAGQ